jgi:hypothetical protein
VKPGLPSRVTIDVLRQVAKSCVVKREFKRAGLLARQAVCLAKDVFDKDHPKYSDTLLDFGFFLLNFDSIRQSVGVYEVSFTSHAMNCMYNGCQNNKVSSTIKYLQSPTFSPCVIVQNVSTLFSVLRKYQYSIRRTWLWTK